MVVKGSNVMAKSVNLDQGLACYSFRRKLIWVFTVLANNLNPLFAQCQGPHSLEKYLNIEGFLEKYLKIKSALKSTVK